MTTFLEQLSAYTKVVIDAGDMHAVGSFHPLEVTLSPALITATLQMPQYQSLVSTCLGQHPNSIEEALQTITVAMVQEIIKLGAGRVAVDIDARLAHDQQAIITYSEHLIDKLRCGGVDLNRITLKIPATWAGIKAGSALHRSGIACHGSLVFGLHQAVGCAQAGFTAVSTLVGRILDWYKRHSAEDMDLGVAVVSNFYNYFHKFAYPTQIIGSGFRNVGQVISLAGCDFLVVSPGLWSDLHQSRGKLMRQLTPQNAQSSNLHSIVVDQTTFATLHQADQMASEKLEEGLRGYCRSMHNLENLLTKKMQQISSGSSLNQAANTIFQVYDIDGDGFVTREEWLGADAVFDALDVDHDGKITPDEILIGLGVYL